MAGWNPTGSCHAGGAWRPHFTPGLDYASGDAPDAPWRPGHHIQLVETLLAGARRLLQTGPGLPWALDVAPALYDPGSGFWMYPSAPSPQTGTGGGSQTSRSSRASMPDGSHAQVEAVFGAPDPQHVGDLMPSASRQVTLQFLTPGSSNVACEKNADYAPAVAFSCPSLASGRYDLQLADAGQWACWVSRTGHATKQQQAAAAAAQRCRVAAGAALPHVQCWAASLAMGSSALCPAPGQLCRPSCSRCAVDDTLPVLARRVNVSINGSQTAALPVELVKVQIYVVSDAISQPSYGLGVEAVHEGPCDLRLAATGHLVLTARPQGFQTVLWAGSDDQGNIQPLQLQSPFPAVNAVGTVVSRRSSQALWYEGTTDGSGSMPLLLPPR